MRDARWENVYASIGDPLSYTGADEAYAVYLDEVVEIRIEVVYKEQRIYHVSRVHKDEIKKFWGPDLVKMHLNKSVEMLDEALEKIG